MNKIVLFSLIFFLSSCGHKKSETIKSQTESKTILDNRIRVTQSQFTQSKMRLGSFEEKPFPRIVTVNGMIDVPPENKAVVSTSMGGYIKTTPLLIGDKVSKGQVLVTIENPEFVLLQQQYLEINAQLTYLKAEYDRQVIMKAENITSQKKYLKAESDYKTAVSRYLGLDKQLRMLNFSPTKVREEKISSVTNIYAPIAGNITKVNVFKGSYVSPASEIVEIINNEPIHLELSVFEKDIMKVKTGQKIDFKIPEVSEDTYQAEVHLVGTFIEADRTIKVHGHLEKESEVNFLTGMFVNARITTDSKLARALPSESIAVVDEISYILVFDKKEGDTYYFSQIEVEVKESYDGYSIVESKNEFEAATQFLIRGAYNLLGE
jgi:cobalt-zinc-cadmium efflux system membrane fusion protein